MRIVMGGVYQPFIDGSSVSIKASMSDPVPTCSLNLQDNNSSIVPIPMQELLVIDDQVIPNPTVNMLLNPAMNPYTSNWAVTAAGTGRSYAQIGGGGIAITFTNFSGSPTSDILTTGVASVRTGAVVAGQIYTASVVVQGASSPTNLQASLTLIWLDATQNTISTAVFTGPNPPSTSLTRYSVSGTAPANAVAAWIKLTVTPTSGTNSGIVNFTQAQLEPNWIPTQTYPTAWCGPSQTNCVQLPLGYYIRQYRKFAGFVIHSSNNNYLGNVRTVSISAVGYAWLMSTITVNDSFSNKTDAQIITTLLANYLLSNGTAMTTTTNVVTGATLTTFASNWDDLRTLFDNLASQSGFYWTVNYYWDFIYAPPGYYAMPINLICDNSSTPDMVTSYPAYNFSAENDYTQPGSTILVLGSGSNSAKVIDGSTTISNGIISGYFLPTGSSYMRKVNESTLGSNADCVTRGIAEMLQYDSPRDLYHLTTNVELLAGQSIQITSSTEGLIASTQLLQNVTTNWIGTQELLTDTWEYVADLGATNRATINIMSRLFRLANANSSAVAIGTTALALIENLGMQDAASTGVASTAYQSVVLADGPLGYFRLNELSGTVADDYSGHAYNGTYHNGFTLNQTGLLTTIAGKSTLFDGSSGFVSNSVIPVPTGAASWSLECWCKLVAFPTSPGFTTLLGWGNNASHAKGSLLVHNNSGTNNFVLSCFSADITGTTVLSLGTIYHVVGTYDGSNTRLYVNGALEAGPTAFTLNLTASFASIAAENATPTDFFNGYLQEAAYYTTTLSAAQVLAHYNAR